MYIAEYVILHKYISNNNEYKKWFTIHTDCHESFTADKKSGETRETILEPSKNSLYFHRTLRVVTSYFRVRASYFRILPIKYELDIRKDSWENIVYVNAP